ncbi:hypothetical protein EYF80_043056 [Liparis tanakae]|uniref:Uncharacterized protein n=1 Tax=Liparis tanakae TaxID=230148 RepID=A0A4Z2G1E3_9TELE|nr:hypothetical protein EYF80_043056 [Liparis tanakae]
MEVVILLESSPTCGNKVSFPSTLLCRDKADLLFRESRRVGDVGPLASFEAELEVFSLVWKLKTVFGGSCPGVGDAVTLISDGEVQYAGEDLSSSSDQGGGPAPVLQTGVSAIAQQYVHHLVSSLVDAGLH